MNVTYDSYNLKDINEIKELWKELNLLMSKKTVNYKETYESKEFNERIKPYVDKVQKGKYLITIAKSDSNKVGYCISSVNEMLIGEVDSIYVKDEYRGYNIGEHLMKEAVDFFETNNVKKQILVVTYGNDEVMKFYNKFGFYATKIELERK